MEGEKMGKKGEKCMCVLAWRVGGWKLKQNVQGRPSLRGDFGESLEGVGGHACGYPGKELIPGRGKSNRKGWT